MSQHGKNVQKLIAKFASREAIPAGGGLSDAMDFFSNPERRQQIFNIAEKKAQQAIELIKNHPDNPFGKDDELIAGELLKRLEEKYHAAG